MFFFSQVINRHKPWDTDFTVQLRNEAYNINFKQCKNYPVFMVRLKGGGGRIIAPSPLNTPLAPQLNLHQSVTDRQTDREIDRRTDRPHMAKSRYFVIE